MFSAAVAGTSNLNFRSDKMRDMRSDNMSSETDASGDRVNMSQAEHTCREAEQQAKCVKKFKTSLYICVLISIIIGTVLCIIYVALGGLQ